MTAGSDPPAPVRLEKRGPVALLWLDKPPVNVLGAKMLDALVERLDEVERDPEYRVVVLASAQERAFAAGANIREMAPLDIAGARVHGGRGQGVTVRLERLPLPVIAAVHGTCVGGGCEVALACDLIVASDDAVFGQPEINLGVMPGWGGTQRLPHRVGEARARWWIYSGESVPAAEAAAQGLVLKVVPRAELLSTALGMAETLATKPPIALAAAKYAIHRAAAPGLESGLLYELELWSRLFGTLDQKEGMQAFLEKRLARYRGRSDWAMETAGFPWEDRGAE
ncbi:MAG TPA: enoyl-CoA hydratase-related protein [Thermoplasmata archaeon]|nr:enoyl-CoA hydratase-related protein [Thermoplasmata archaeon]